MLILEIGKKNKQTNINKQHKHKQTKPHSIQLAAKQILSGQRYFSPADVALPENLVVNVSEVENIPK